MASFTLSFESSEYWMFSGAVGITRGSSVEPSIVVLEVAVLNRSVASIWNLKALKERVLRGSSLSLTNTMMVHEDTKSTTTKNKMIRRQAFWAITSPVPSLWQGTVHRNPFSWQLPQQQASRIPEEL